jgi:hypothetical protein
MDREEQEYSNRKMQQLANLVDENLPGGAGEFGFCLFVFGLDDPKSCNYISNCGRESIVQAVGEWLKRN